MKIPFPTFLFPPSFFQRLGMLLLILTTCVPALISGSSHAATPSPNSATNFSKNSKSPLQQGKMLFETRCINCHTLPKPSSHSSSEWPSIMNRMGPKAYLKPDEQKWVLQYIQATLQGRKKSS